MRVPQPCARYIKDINGTRLNIYIAMRKLYFAALSLAFAASPVLAQSDSDRKTYSFEEFEFLDDYGDEYPDVYYPSGCVSHVSANGEYAVGYDDARLFSNTGGAFLWKRSEPAKLFQLGHLQDRISACDVSDGGIVVGSCESRPDVDTKVECYPGYMDVSAGLWKPLPVPEEYSLYYAKRSDLAEEARAITPDARYIAGNFHYKIGEKDVLGTLVDQAIIPVALWEKDGDGYILKNCWTELGKAGCSMQLIDGELQTMEKEVNYRCFLVCDISNDGRTIVGMNESWRGGFNPAFVRDGKLVQLFNCGDEGEPDEDANFNGGVILTIDANGNMYGYYMEDDGFTTKYFVYTAEGNMEYVDDPAVCGDKNGNRFTAYSNGLSPVTDCSEDGSVIVGGGIGDLGFGVYQYPKISVDNSATGVATAGADASWVSLDFNGGIVILKGCYMYANVFNASGALVDGGKCDAVFDLNGHPSGTYIVKAVTASGIKTFKVAK